MASVDASSAEFCPDDEAMSTSVVTLSLVKITEYPVTFKPEESA